MRLVTYRSTVEAAARLGAVVDDLVVDVEEAGHHAGVSLPSSMLDFIDLGPPALARRALAERGTAYVALCPDSSEIARFRSAAPDGFAAQLADGREFDWLEPLAVPAGSNLEVWRIRP